MKLRKTALMLAGLFLVAISSAGSAASLAGNKGDVRFYPYVSGSLMEPCTKAYKAYVAASGHSAYASTPYARVRSLYIVCGSRLNAPSQKAAEEGALKSCQAGLNGHKFTTAGRCEIAASK
ncbi:hypothetical protein [Mesorhizobium neociceri]|uniref:DUF4189 domain-containing protein n=1 Tax=Mesorhizobium neociceri TaxID=1307853 RepID=A0A838B622_9HYPH|nr:hypothetical protein [Mesorhizobium neociceri]MBA1142066.1 hypothetical protein [Mesorhizobium neociceri]